MCGAQCGHFIAAKFAGCKDSACGGRIFCQQTSQINIHCCGGGTFPVHLGIWKWKSCIASADGTSSTAASNLIFLGQHTIQHCWSVFIFLSCVQQVTEEAGWSFPVCSIRDHCGQCQMRLDRLWWNGFTGPCLEHLLCCSEASVRRVWERGSWSTADAA